MKTRRVIVGMLAALFFALPEIAAGQSVTARAVVSNSTPAKGAVITVAVNIDMAQTGALLGSYSATLAWNPSVLTYKSTTGGTTSGFSTPNTNTANVGIGELRFNQFNAAGSGGVVNVITVSFEVIGNPGNTSQLDLSFTAMDAASTFANLLPSATVVDGSVQIPAQEQVPISANIQVPNASAIYGSTVQVPINITDATNQDIVAVEVFISSNSGVADILGIDTTGTLVGGWAMEDTVLSGADGLDTLKAVMTTLKDTLTGSGIVFNLRVKTANVRHPASTELKLVHVILNEEDRKASSQSGSIKIIGTDGSIDASPATVSPGDVLTITMTDADENRNSGNAEQKTVKVISKKLGDIENKVLSETTAGSGIFTGSVTTRYKTSGATTDGTLDVTRGDTVAVIYVDSLSAAGATIERRDSSAVLVVGVNGTLQTTYVMQARNDKNGLRDTLRVRVTDADLNASQTQIDNASVVVENKTSGELENLQVAETGVNTGVFQARVPTQYGTSGTNNNGVLSMAGGNTISVRYVDELKGDGSSQTLEKLTYTVNLFGDVSGNGEVCAFDGHPILGMVLGIQTASFQDSLTADMDGNCNVTPYDVAMLLQYLIDIIKRFPVQTDITFSGGTDWKNHPFLKPISPYHTVVLGELQNQLDGTFLLPIVLNERDQVISGSMQISLDEVVEVEEVVPGEGFDDFLMMHTTDAKTVRLVFAGALPAGSGPGPVAHIRIRLAGDGSPLLRLEGAELNEQEVAVGSAVASSSDKMPRSFALMQNYPNPFNPTTTIQYYLPQEARVSITVFNLAGQLVRVLENAHQSAGEHAVIWDGTDDSGQVVTNGLYLYRIWAGEFKETKKMILLK